MRGSFALAKWEECSLIRNVVRMFFSPSVPFVDATALGRDSTSEGKPCDT